MVGDEVAVAERPVDSAAASRTAGTNDGAPQDDQNEKAEDDPSEPRSRLCIAFYFKYRRACHGTILLMCVMRADCLGEVAYSELAHRRRSPTMTSIHCVWAVSLWGRRTNAELFFCINLAEGRRERFG